MLQSVDQGARPGSARAVVILLTDGYTTVYLQNDGPLQALRALMTLRIGTSKYFK